MHEIDPRRATRDYPTVLGLRGLPIGIWLLTIALPGLGLFPSPAHILLLALAVGGVWLVHLWYRREFGIVDPGRLRLGRTWALVAGLGALFAAFGLGEARLGQGPLVVLLALLLFATAAAFVMPRGFAGDRRTTGVVLAASVLLCALLLLLGRIEPGALPSFGKLFSLLLGVLLCVAAVAEHRSLRKALPPPGGGADG